MFDLHTHILPGLDDGAEDIDTCISMLEIASKDGTTHVFATPHFIKGNMDNNSNRVKNAICSIRQMIKAKSIGIDILAGNEVFISHDLPSIISSGEVCTLNDSSYVLVELPMSSFPAYTMDVLFKLKLDGYTPIIAHPERNQKISSNLNIVYDLVERGALIQINSTSINGLFGSSIKENALKLIEHNLVHFIASDAHTLHGRSPKLKKCRDYIQGKYGEEVAAALFYNNALSVKDNKCVNCAEPRVILNRKNFFVSSLQKIFAL